MLRLCPDDVYERLAPKLDEVKPKSLMSGEEDDEREDDEPPGNARKRSSANATLPTGGCNP